MTTRNVSFPEMTDSQRRISRAARALHRDGARPAGALDLLAAIVEDRDWERALDRDGRPFAGRFREFVAAGEPYGLGFGVDQLPKVLELRHPRETVPEVADRMQRMRAEVRMLLLKEIEPTREHRGATVSERNNRVGTTNSIITPSNDSDYVVSRLKRDDPNLAERVVNGEMSAYAAARSKGWKPPRIQITTPERTAKHLRKHMNPDQLRELARLLTEPTE